MASRPAGSRAGSRDRLDESGDASVRGTAAADPRETPALRSRPTSRAPSQERLLEAPGQPRPTPAARPASLSGNLDSDPAERLSAEPQVPLPRRGSREMLDAGGPRPPPGGGARAASREDLSYVPRQQEPLYPPASYATTVAAAAAAVVRSASREQLDPESSLYAPRSVPRSASRELLDRGAGGGYERRFQSNPSAAFLYGSKNPDSKSRSSSMASLSAVGQPAPKYSQKPYFPNYAAPRYSRPKHVSTTREPGYYNLATDTVVRTRKLRTRTYMYVGRPWTKGFSTSPRNFLALAVVAFFFCPPLGVVALVYAVLSKKAASEENYAASGRYGVVAFRMSVATMVVGVVCWIALVALIHSWRFVAHRIH